MDDLTFGENRLFSDGGFLQCDLDEFVKWSQDNVLGLNPAKCQLLQICFKNKIPPPPTLKIGEEDLSFVPHAKILGVRIQDDLKWDKQVINNNNNSEDL